MTNYSFLQKKIHNLALKFVERNGEDRPFPRVLRRAAFKAGVSLNFDPRDEYSH